MTFSDILWGCIRGRISLSGTSWHKAMRKLLIGSLGGACLVLVFEPDHTSDLPLLTAFGLWSTHIFFALLLFIGSVVLLLRIGAHDPLPAVISTLLLPVIFAPVSFVLDIGFGKPDEELSSTTNTMAVYLSEVVAVMPVSLAAALILLIFLYWNAATRDGQADSAVADTKEQPHPELSELISAIPRSLGNDIIRMHAQDHYVEVITAAGRTLILERLRDCADLLECFHGLQCHRSHWINLDYVENVSPSGSAYICELSNGDRVPVSRRRYSELKQRLVANLPNKQPNQTT